MGIVIVSGTPEGRVARFRDYARGRGWDAVALAPRDRVPGGTAPDAVVLFADGSDEPAGPWADLVARTRYLGGPVVVVAAGRPESWLGRGATAVCGPDSRDADVAAAVESNRDARPVPPGLAADLLDPLVSAVAVTLQELCAAAAVPRASYLRPVTRTLGDVSGAIRVTGAIGGCVVVNCPAATAAAVAGRMLAEARVAPDAAMVGDCIGEIANVVAGQAKTSLSGTSYRFKLTTPVVVGPGYDVGPGTDSLIVAFDSELGPLALQLVLAQDPGTAK